MPDKNIKFELLIVAPVHEVFSALTNASALSEWLCSVALTDVQKGGRIYLWWENGYYASGEFINLIPGDRVIFSWHGKGEPGVSRVKIVLKPVDDETHLRLSHLDLGESETWKQTRKLIKRGWRFGLENLKSVLETGEDLRFSRRPMLGFTSIQALSAEEAVQSGLPAIPGLFILGVMEGLCADKAGLQGGDYLIKFSGQEVHTLIELNDLLDLHRAGDKVKMVFYRIGEERVVKGELSRRPVPDIPDDPEELSLAVEKLYTRLNIDLEEVFRDVDERWIDFGSSATTWSVRETLGHLISNEREMHGLITRMIEGQPPDFTLRANQPVRVRATISAFPTLSSLLAELKRNQTETVAMIADLPSDFISHRRSYWRLALELLQNPPLHYQEHIILMQHMIQKARNAVVADTGSEIQTLRLAPDPLSDRLE